MTFLIAYSSLALLILAYGIWQASSVSEEPWEEEPDHDELLNRRLREWKL